MLWRCVEAGDVLVALATGLNEVITVFHADLFNRFQAVRGKAGANDLK